MKIEDCDVTVSMSFDGVYMEPLTEAGDSFLNYLWNMGLFISITAETLQDHIPPGLRVGLRNPETNLFAQLPPRSLH